MHKILGKPKELSLSLSLSRIFHPKIRNLKSKFSFSTSAFTIVELLIVIVIIGILATVVIVAYSGITTKARQVTLQSDLANSRTKMEIANASDGRYPSESTVTANQSDYLAQTGTNEITYHTNANGSTYCISAVGSDSITYVLSNLTGPFTGSCTGTDSEIATAGDGSPAPTVTYIQTITDANCPSTMTRVADARDNHTYWVQKLADGKCWMLTNLGYAGGGTNTYNDVIPTGTGSTGTLSGPDNAGATTYTLAKYYIPTGSNVTTEPTNPSTTTDGGATNPQYGYLYNWCAAMGSQATAACANATTSAPVTTTSICPAGWRLPTGNNAEMKALNDAVNTGKTNSDSGLITSPWLGQRSGVWVSGFYTQGTYGSYWSSAQYSATNSYNLRFDASNVSPAYNNNKFNGFAVRCVAAV